MEGTLLEVAAMSSLVFMGGVSLLALAVSAIFFGYMADEEKSGRRLFWAEWPLPETGEEEPEKFESLDEAA
jgi:hypothetical protein